MVLQGSAPLEQLGVFEIELANIMTELKFSVFNQVGDLLLMGTNQGMLLTFRFFPDGGMEVLGCGRGVYLLREQLLRVLLLCGSHWHLELSAVNRQ